MTRRIVILGGGAAAMSAAYWLTQGDWQQEFDSVTVYQRGWRLGGKGASGRGQHGRIEEHGLHVWFGFYENAFRTLRGCYEQLGRPDTVPISSIESGFQPAASFLLTERRPEGWVPWSVQFPDAPGVPGDLTRPAGELPELSELLEQGLHLLRAQLKAARSGRHLDQPETTEDGSGPAEHLVRIEPVPAAGDPEVRLQPVVAGPASGGAAAFTPTGGRWWRRMRKLVDAAESALHTLPLDLADEALRLAAGVAASLHRADVETPEHPHDRILEQLEVAAGLVGRYLRPLAEDSDFLRRQWYLIDLLLACVRGTVADGLLTGGLRQVDHVEFVDWLVRHGAEEESARSVLVTTLVYDLAFAYRNGDSADPACSAATALGGLIRVFFDYHGAIAYKMRAGMGDTVFGPLYQLLRARGVRFEFFHDVRGLHLSDDGRRIERISLARQLRLRDPEREYQPLVDEDTPGRLPVWPAEPIWDQLEPVDGLDPRDLEHQWAEVTAEHFEIRVGDDFDEVVLGIGVGALERICADLVERDPSWRSMVTELGTVWTQALQLWLSQSTTELGDPLPGATTGGFLEPFDTYADMSHLIEREDWGDEVAGLAYFCNVLPTPTGPPTETDAQLAAQAQEEVRRNALRFLQHDVGYLLPGVSRRYPSDFRWELLVGDDAGDGDEQPGPKRLDSQYWRANVDPSDRYVQSLPGTGRWRLRPGDSHVDNLVLAGDWTDCGLNAGCVEAAVSSGMLAAHALCGRPGPEDMRGISELVVPPRTASPPAGSPPAVSPPTVPVRPVVTEESAG